MFLTSMGGRLTAVLVVAAMVVPGTALAQDLRSPDARDATSAREVATRLADDLRSPDASDLAVTLAAMAPTDLRSPDAVDAAGGIAVAPALAADLRTPDARDAADGRQVISNPILVVEPAADEFDWGDAAIGAAIALALAALAAGGALLYTRRRRRPVAPVTTAPTPAAVRHHGRARRGPGARPHAGAR